MVNFLGIMQNEWAGAQAFSSFDTYLAPFVKKDNLSYKEVKQCVQSFIYGVNTPSRWGTQAPFSNITLDWTCPDDLKDVPLLWGARSRTSPMGTAKRNGHGEQGLHRKHDRRGRQRERLPVSHSHLFHHQGFDWSETENNRLLFEMTAKYGTPYFSNYINSDMKPSDVRSMCCRLRLDLRELRKNPGLLRVRGIHRVRGGGHHQHAPDCLPAKDKKDFYDRLDHMMDIAARSLKTKRTVITKLLDAGLYPYTKRYLGTFKNHFSTIGLIGMNEVGLNANWLRKDLTHPETLAFTKEVLTTCGNG